jgi:hypothetical protein
VRGQPGGPLSAADAAHLQLDTLRLRVLKIGGWVREVADRYGPDLCLYLSGTIPVQPSGACWLPQLASMPGSHE